MRKFYFVSLLALAWVVAATSASAQNYYTKQVIIVNGGDYGNPDDYVTVASYDPVSGETTEFATIYTQSVQDVLIVPPYAYVAAQDSIVKLNIDTYEKVASVAATGINKLISNGEVLVASFWYPATENFVRTYSLDDLSLIHEFGDVSDEAAGMMVMQGAYVLVAVPGAYGSTTGKVAVIDLNNNVVMSEDDYGEFFTGIGYFAENNGLMNVFMKTAYGESTFNVATVNFQGEIVDQFTYEDESLVNAAGQLNGNIYLELNNGIGEYNLNTHEITNASVVPVQEMTIAASVLDTVNNLFYLTTTDFYSAGAGFVYNMEGEQTGSFEAGISAQAIAVDYREATGIKEQDAVELLTVFPNPATERVNLNISADQQVGQITVTDVSGKVVISLKGERQLNVNSLSIGLYFVTVTSDKKVYSGKFIKN
jgi:hypothetical protein